MPLHRRAAATFGLNRNGQPASGLPASRIAWALALRLMHGGPASTGSPMPGAAFENPIARTGEGRGEGVGGGTEGSAGSAGDGVTPCKSRIAGSAILAGAVAGAGPKAPGVIEPVGERGSASVVPSNSNSRRGRMRSPLRQGRDRMDPI